MFDDDDNSDADDLQSHAPACVYFLSLVDPLNPNRDFGLVKVGITKGAVETRIGHLQTGNPYRIQIEGEIRTPVAPQLERWLHSTEEVAHLEWLRLTRDRVQPLIEKARAENERLCEIASARAHWAGAISNGNERPCSSEEARIFNDARGVLEDY